MSVDAKAATGTLPDDAGPEPPAARDTAGLVFGRLTVTPALLALAWLLSGLVFFCAGWFRPVPVTALAVILAVPLLWFGLRAVPALPGRTPWWPLAAVAVIAAAFFAYQAWYHGQWVIMTRDPGSYFEFASWLAKNGSSRVPAGLGVFGGTHGGAVTFNTYGTYFNAASGTVILQFMAGFPMVLAGAMWAGGYPAALLTAPLLGALAVVTLSGLAARLIGARWAPLAALVTAVSLPMQYTSRVTYSEPLAEILFLGGLALVLDGVRRDREHQGPRAARGARLAAGLGGLALGLAVLVRIDGLSDLLPVIPFCGALFVRRRPQAGWLAAGLAAGTALGAGEGLVYSWPYLMVANRSSVLPLAALTALVIAVTAAGTWFFRRRPLPSWWPWLPNIALAVPFALIAVFAVRPYFQTTRGTNGAGNPIRLYSEISLHWVDWYAGLPVIVLATAGAALLARRCLRGEAGDWAMPLMVMSWAVTEFLYRPAITPDQPWASRRLVPAVLPSFILLAVWTIAYLRRTTGLRRTIRVPVPLRIVLAGICAVAAVIPAVQGSWGLGVSRSGGLHLTADGLMGKRTVQGELDAVREVCADLPARAAVVFLGPDEAPVMMQDIRATCDVPAGEVSPVNGKGQQVMSNEQATRVVRSVVADIRRSGRTPAIVALNGDSFDPYRGTGTVRKVFTLNTTFDPNVIWGPPTEPEPHQFQLWMWRPSS